MAPLLPYNYVSASIAISCVPFLFGMDTGSIGPITTMPAFRATFGEFSSLLHGVIVSSILIPGALTALVAGALAHRFGHIRLVALGSVIYGIGSAIECSAFHLGVYIVGRLFKGVGQGLFLSNVYVQVSEMSPARVRGVTTALPQFAISFGLVSGYFICYGTTSHIAKSSSLTWRLPLAIASLLAFLFSSTFFLVPPSPRWLLSRGRVDEAQRICNKLGIGNAEISDLFNQDRVSVVEITTQASLWKGLRQSIRELGLAFTKIYRARTAFACFLMATQQFSGIDGVLFYAPILFTQAGLSSEKAAFFASGVSALTILAATIPGIFLADKWGRRTSTMFGGICMAVLMLIMGSLYAGNQVNSTGPGRWVVVVCIYLFAIIFSFTWAIGIRTWVVESMPKQIRSSASSLAQSLNWSANFIVALITPVLLASSSCGAYYLFGGITLMSTVVIYFFMYETRGYSLEEIERRQYQGMAESAIDLSHNDHTVEKKTPATRTVAASANS